jgi:integrase
VASKCSSQKNSDPSGHNAAAHPVQTDVRVPPESNEHNDHLHPSAAAGNVLAVAPDQRRKGKSMSRLSGQKGQVVRKGAMWHLRFYVDVPGTEKRQRKSVPIGPAVGKKLTKPEAIRKGAEIIAEMGVNSAEHLERAIAPTPIVTFGHRVDWCLKYHPSWTDSRPHTIRTMESALAKHILPRFGSLPLDAITETAVQEFAADLKQTTFQRHRKNGSLIKRYKLSRKSILEIVDLVKRIVGKKVWATWEWKLPKAPRRQQRYFTQAEIQKIINAAHGQYRVLFALLAGTGMRISEAAGLYVGDLDLANCVIRVRRGIVEGIEQDTKTESGERIIDIAPELAALLQQHLAGRKSGCVFQARNGAPIHAGNLRKRVLHQLLEKLGIPRGGFHAYRHARVTILRKKGTPPDLQTQWIGHSSLRVTDGYCHTNEEVGYRQQNARRVGLGFVIGPNGPKPSEKAANESAA